MPGPILAIDDDAANRRLLVAMFRADGVAIETAEDGERGLAQIAALDPELVLLDLQMPGLDGLAVLERVRATRPDTPVIVLTASTDVRHAVRAIQLGAFDYLTKPLDGDQLAVAVRRARETRALKDEVTRLRATLGSGGSLVDEMGASQAIARVVEQVETVARTTFSVLLAGETGTGKELVARAVHRHSDRRARPFIALDCGAIPEALLESELFGHERGAFTGADRKRRGQFDLATGGTVFLDEIGNLPIGLQAKLLRVLESRQVLPLGAAQATTLDVRFVAATNDDFEARVAAGKFRADLYFRLAQYTITLPPLRERREDILHLATRFLTEVCIELRRPVQALAPEAVALLERYAWPGNVRELRNVIRQAVLETSGVVLARSAIHVGGRAAVATTERGAAGRSLKEIAETAAQAAERAAIVETLRATRGNKSEAARVLRTDYKTLHLKLKKLGIRARDFGP